MNINFHVENSVVDEKTKDVAICVTVKNNGDYDGYPFAIKDGHVQGDEFFSRVAESLQLRQFVSMSNNKLSEKELEKIIAILNEE